jgi:glutamine cyclotransferase
MYFIDPQELKVNRVVTIHDPSKKGIQLSFFNELEYIEGYVYANVWTRNYIVVIDPGSGEIVRYIDMSKIVSSENTNNREHVLNGIAYDKETKQ